VSDTTIAVGVSFVATIDAGGECLGSSPTFGPEHEQAMWFTADTTIVSVDSTTGLVTGKSIGSATVRPDRSVTTGPKVISVHVH
jgi:hypothetical protein